MTRPKRHAPISPRELRRLRQDSFVSTREFAAMTGADERRVRRWFSGDEPDTPLWVAVLLLALAVPEARAAVRHWVAIHVTPTRGKSDADDDAA
jgi:DNA-binding transcriptional regulator YiaG